VSPELHQFDRVMVLSDLHIPPATHLGNFHSGDELVSWTNAHLQSPGAKSVLVLAGDIIDFLLLEERPKMLDLAGAALMVRGVLERLTRDAPWVTTWRAALGRWLQGGGHLILIPGNHDPEWLHPGAAAELCHWLTEENGTVGFHVHRRSGPWRCLVGNWDVTIGHGHRADPVNDIDPAAVERALYYGKHSIPLPPGSQLVLGPVLQFKRAMHRNRPRFPFLDAVKPEAPALLLLLLYLDSKMLLYTLPSAIIPLWNMLKRNVSAPLRGGPVLEFGTTAGRSDRDNELEHLAAEMATELLAALEPDDRLAVDATLAGLDAVLSGAESSPVHGTLAVNHSRLGRSFLRAWLHRERETSQRFFDVQKPGGIDRRIIDQLLRDQVGPRVVIAGHTHAARDIRLPNSCVYLNTGTWTNLLDLSDYPDDGAMKKLIDTLDAGSPPQLRRLSWAEVTADGPKLHEWPAPEHSP
jgi:UDP-2,3-diacylglucosamine pyrophosphatase LpxH